MKKIVILILVLLPIVLLITIAFAGKILSYYYHIPVERVEFVDDVGDALDDEHLFIVNVGHTKPTSILVYPELASNPAVSYTSQDEAICTVDAEGKITGVATGHTSVVVTSVDGDKTDSLTVLVVDEFVRGITLDKTELTMNIGEMTKLLPEIVPYSALNKHITFTSSDNSIVSVKQNGQITAVSAGTAVITVTTKEGGFTATCTVTVSDGIPPLRFEIPEAENINNVYVVKNDTLNLADYLIHDEAKVDPSTIQWRIVGSAATLDGSQLSFTVSGPPVTVYAYVGDSQAPTYSTAIKLVFKP